MRPERYRRGREWRRAAVVALVALAWIGGMKALRSQSEDAAHDLHASESGMGSVAEEELAPTLESNRQPLAPDPLVLPQWTGEEAAALDGGRPVNLGGGLWSSERYPLQPSPPWPPVPAPGPLAAPGVLGWKLMSQYGAARHWCVDPQRTLDGAHRARIEAHLAAHARTAYHPVRVWVLAQGQSLAGSLDDATVHRASFGPDRPGVLVVLTGAEPLAARVLAPPRLAPRAASWITGIVSHVAPHSPPVEQLDHLVLWLTLRADELPTIEADAAAPGLNVARAPVPPAGRPDEVPRRRWWWLVAAALAAAGIGWRAWGRRREAGSVEPSPLLWLETDRPVRLGGPHSGGAGAVVKW